MLLKQGGTMETGSFSNSKISTFLTPAKRAGLPIKDLFSDFDEISETKVAPLLRIKKEENKWSCWSYDKLSF